MPADASADQARGITIEVSFNAPVAATSVTSASVQLLGPEGNAIPCRLSVEGAVIRLRPSAVLPGSTRFRIAIAGSVTDSKGRALVAAVSAQFTTAAQGWASTAASVGTLSGHTGGTQPTLLALPSGEVLLAWTESRRNAISALRFQAGAWSSVSTIETTAEVRGPLNLSALPNGDAVMIWTEFRPAAIEVVGAQYSAASGSWTSLGVIKALPNGASTVEVRAIADGLGNLYVLASTGVDLYATRFDASQATWGPAQRIDPGGYLLSLRCGVDASNAVIAAWIQDASSDSRATYVARFDPINGSWQPAQRVGPDAMQFMDMAVAPDGAVTLAWASQVSAFGSPRLWASHGKPALGQWSMPQRLDGESPNFTGSAPALVVDVAGYVTAVWGEGGSTLWSRLNPVSKDWSGPAQLPGQAIGGRLGLRPLADTAGNVVLVGIVELNQIVAWRYSATYGQWQAGVSIGALESGSVTFANDPAVAVDHAGNASAAWFVQASVDGAHSFPVVVNRLQ